MRVKIFGAAGGEVTGSCYLVQTDSASVLVDLGMFQGGRSSEIKNKIPPGLSVKKINAVLLTHGHLDHTGRLPLLVKLGYKNPIFGTEQTHELTQIILQDSARLQAGDAMRQNRKFLKRGQRPVETLYSLEHVEYMKELNQSIVLSQPVVVAKGITARWIEAGHMLGSGSIELTILERGKKKIVAFSGDLGPVNFPLLKAFDHFSKADLLFIESTYGDRDHRSYAETLNEFKAIVQSVSSSGGKVFVPCFAIGRAQQIIYHMAELFSRKEVKQFPVYLDSPMALKALEVYKDNQNLLDSDFHELKRKGVFPMGKTFFIPSPTGESSKAINDVKGPCMVLAGAGMCNGGRILHHLFHNLEDPKAHIMIVGFQSQGSIGRRLVEKVPTISIFGKVLKVKATIHTLGGFSAHAGQTDLLKWLSYVTPSKPKIMLTHGEDGPRQALAACITRDFKIKANLPLIGDVVEI